MKSQTVYILGAGASRFTGFPLGVDLRGALDWVNTSRQIFPCSPIKKDAAPEEAGRLCLEAIDRVRTIFQREITDLELTLTLVDLINFPGNQLRLNSDLAEYDFKEVWRVCTQLIAQTFQHLSQNTATHIYETSTCGKCEKMQHVMTAWANLVHSDDILITFNWDVLHEMILWKAGKWDYGKGYGVTIGENEENRSSVTLLKLHGLCNWAMRSPGDSKIELDYQESFFPNSPEGKVEEGLPSLGSTPDFGDSLILPSYLKAPLGKPVLLSIWQQASEAIKSAGKIVAIGYSLPIADAPTRTMLALALKSNDSLETISVVLPKSNSNDQSRWQVFCSSIGKSVHPIYKSFEEYVLESGVET